LHFLKSLSMHTYLYPPTPTLAPLTLSR
jgi:hypothetical protein